MKYCSNVRVTVPHTYGYITLDWVNNCADFNKIWLLKRNGEKASDAEVTN